MTGPNNKMRRLALIGGVAAAVFCGVAATAMAGDEFVAWKRQLGTADLDYATGVATDAAGNVYLTGGTFGWLSHANRGFLDAWVAKYAADGHLLWTRQLGSADYDYATGVATDAAGNVYLTGYTSGSFGGPKHGGLNDLDAWVAKFAADGQLLWKQQLGTESLDYSYGVATDAVGNVYLTGFTKGSLGGSKVGGPLDTDAWVAEYATDGQLLWTQQLGTRKDDHATGVATDTEGNVFLTGGTYGWLGGANKGYLDAWVAKYATDGQLLWTRQLGSASGDDATGVATDAAGNVYVAGQTYGSLGSANKGRVDAWLAKYTTNGQLLWTLQGGSRGDDQVSGVATDAAGNVYLAGWTYGSFGGPKKGQSDAWVAKYDTSGHRLWGRQPGTEAHDYARGIATDAIGNVYVTGGTGGSLGGSKHSDSPYDDDAWIMKFSETAAAADWSIGGPIEYSATPAD